ncbi:hypothetical protein [Cysteiniphilum sp. 6C5]|uniref:hypothetical protein n=1 Tax=unclassified Cysteiniphilum TaxID=2610889 RepID=UPI003F872170
MAKISPEQVFTKNDLHRYSTCCKFYPKVMQFFGFDVHVQCLVNNDHMSYYFYLEIKGFDFEVKLFASLSLADFYGKLLLLNKVKTQMMVNNSTLAEATNKLLDDQAKFYVIEQDLNDMINLKETDELEFVEVMDSELDRNYPDPQEYSKANDNKTVH